jgi:hypothetical protein
LVTDANDEASWNDRMIIECFSRTGVLMTFTKSESDKLIKPQGVVSKITMPKTYDPKDCETSNDAEFVSSKYFINPEKTLDLLTFMI